MNKELLIGLCIFFSTLQGSVIPFFFDGISQPDLWLVFIIISAMVFPVKYAYVLSIVGGLVQDLIIGNFFGLHLLAYIVITFIFVKFVKGKYNRNWYVSVISVIVGSLEFMGISTLVMWIAGVPLVSFLYLLYIGVPFIGYNAVCAFLLHRPLWYFKIEGESRW